MCNAGSFRTEIYCWHPLAPPGPALESFDLDLSIGTLALTFNEAVSNDTGNIDWTGVSTRTHVNGLEGSGVTLWNTEGEHGWGGPMPAELGLTLAVYIHPVDLDEMKALKIGHNSSYTWLTLRKGAFVAVKSREASEPVYGTQVMGRKGMSVSDLIEDTTRSDVFFIT